MPESNVRKQAAAKKKIKQHEEVVEARREREVHMASPASRRWVPPTFITLGLLGVAWLVVYYIAGSKIAPMAQLGNWNIAIGMGLMAAAFAVMTLWK